MKLKKKAPTEKGPKVKGPMDKGPENKESSVKGPVNETFLYTKPKKKGLNFRQVTEYVGDALIPNAARPKVLHYFERAGVKAVPYLTLGLSAYAIIAAATLIDIVVLNTGLFENINIVIGFLLSLVLIPAFFVVITLIMTVGFKLYLDHLISNKTRKMESVFPEFLEGLAINLKAGQSLENAIQNSTDEKLGPLALEMDRVAKKAKLGKDVDVAIREFMEDFDSETMRESFELIILSWRRGANTPHLVDRILDNLKLERYLHHKIMASVTSYRIFLATLNLVLAPALFALGYNLINVIRSMIAQVLVVSKESISPISLQPVRIDDFHFKIFSLIALVLMAGSTAAIISVIKTGNVKEGMKSIFLYAVGTLISYQLLLLVFSNFFTIFQL